jgi:NADH dehydrogenase (ubiquinone) 1 alpha subcomplex subunit 9
LYLFDQRFCTIAKQGTQVVVPYRDEDAKRHLKVAGDLGQVVFLVNS